MLDTLSAEYTDKPFEGIFFQMFSLGKNQNPCDTKLIEIIPSDSICCYSSNVIKPGWKQHWFSFFGPNPFLKFDFKEYKISLSAYTLGTYSGGEGYGHIKSWVVQGSNDDENYINIDEQKNNFDLNSSSALKTFSFQQSEPFRFIKIMMTDNNHAGTDFLVLRNVEFFGSISK